MTPFTVVIPVNNFSELQAFFWLKAHNIEYDVTMPDYFKDDWNYTFKFKNSEDATFFSLRWA